ncbi:uncharacterized protein LOC114915465, partial [Cajanus cajan]|uniref:uncharacterized protein LOC114915465 n=1 Tax=Cajanus cajan TaxID=3821 RepID=UPI0010FB75D7
MITRACTILQDLFSTIIEYNIGDTEELSKVIDNLQPSHFTNLISFSAKSCDERINKFLSLLIKRSKKLQVIIIEQCKTLEHLFDLEELMPDENGFGKYFTQMKTMVLIELHQLAHIWNKDPTGIFVLENLQIIHIKSCSSLKYLFTPSAAEKLSQLNELKLEGCEMLETVVDNGITKTIKFPTLSKVEFKSLSSLIRFYHHVEFPRLKTLMIEKCPMLEEFTSGFATTDESFTIEGESFSELNEVKIDSCGKLICVVSSRTLQELGNLKKLM